MSHLWDNRLPRAQASRSDVWKGGRSEGQNDGRSDQGPDWGPDQGPDWGPDQGPDQGPDSMEDDTLLTTPLPYNVAKCRALAVK
ncbi:hypothetical protein [Chondromyces apiculatus]|uniref:Uncharacterized protein n=1 Tax=Chondromyces apiculatus DSM 436 TaxID=1192034 RepID=A0A017T580_9BACT|nr:hypothetical protein [Chondromyces apiculatus]EYF04428.1 Hypothetical protein CAP_4567 [Chondromyces apiculatus DSM 436]